VLNLLKSVIIIIRTIEGKSALFLVLVMFTKQKTVIVIILYTVLVNNLFYSAVKAKVNC
jgi:hypothetical protein